MALYSVWDWNKNLYRVYSDALPVSVGVDPDPPRPMNVHLLGAVPFEGCKVLPHGTRFMGLSHVPRGEIVRDASGLREVMGLGSEAGGRTGIGSVALVCVGLAVGYFAGRLIS
jgi:hypothetical protein